MELQTFIEQTLQQVFRGIASCREMAEECGGHINPRQSEWTYGEGWYFDKQTGCPLTKLTFDVAVTAADDEKAKLGAGISVVSFFAGAGKESSVSNASVSRISFELPVALPSSRSVLGPDD